MAYLTINSRFKPFSYAEMLQPVQAATEAHQSLENEYSEYANKANIWEKLADNDYEAYEMYKKYSDDLNSKIDVLAKQGLTPSSRQDLLEMKKRYTSEITPIELAFAKREKMIEEQAKYTAQDDSMLYDVVAKDLKLSDLINNQNLYYTSRSGDKITNRVRTAVNNLAQQMRSDTRTWRSILGEQYYETIMKTGFTPKEVLKVLEKHPEGSEILNRILEDAVDSTGIKDWNNPDALDKAYYYAGLGLWDSVGTTTYDRLDNKGYADFGGSGGDEDPKLENPVYRTLPLTQVDNNIKTSALYSVLKDLELIKENPDHINFTASDIIGSEARYGVTPDTFETYDLWGANKYRKENERKIMPVLNKMIDLANMGISVDIKKGEDGKYVLNNVDDVMVAVSKKIKDSAIRSQSYLLNITDNKFLKKVLNENIASYGARSGHSGLYEINKHGRRGDEIEKDDIIGYMKDIENLEYVPELGFVVAGKDKKGNSNAIVIDTELIDDGQRSLAMMDAMINDYIEEGNYESASTYIDALMNIVYQKFNTLGTIQNTSQKN